MVQTKLFQNNVFDYQLVKWPMNDTQTNVQLYETMRGIAVIVRS